MLISELIYKNGICDISPIWLMGALFYVSTAEAMPAVVPDPIPCVRDLETRFFDERIVNQGLSLYNIRQELWVPINVLLRQKSMSIPDRMKKRTAFMVPNPLEFPMQRAETAKILKDVLFEVLLETMREYQANERPTVDFIFDYIYSEQFPLILKCFGNGARQLLPIND